MAVGMPSEVRTLMIHHRLPLVGVVLLGLNVGAAQSTEYIVSQSIPYSNAEPGGRGKLAMNATGDYCLVAREDCSLVSVFRLEQHGWRESMRLGGDAVSSPSGLALGKNSTALLLGLVDGKVSAFKLQDDALKLQAYALAANASTVTQYRDVVFHPSGRWFYFVADASNQLWGGALSAKAVPSLTQCFEGGAPKGAGRTIGGVRVVETAGIDYPRCPVVSPDGKDLYVACFKNNSVAHFRIDDDNGVLTFVRHVKTDEKAKDYVGARDGLTLPCSIGISLDGKLVIVGGAGKGAAVFMRNSATGEIGDATSLLVDTTIGNMAAIRLSPNGKYMAVVCRDEDYIELFARTAVGKFAYEATLNNNTVSAPLLSRVSDVCFSADSSQLIVTSDVALLASIELLKTK